MSWSMCCGGKNFRCPKLFKYISDGPSLLGANDKHRKTMGGSNDVN